jgi:hypothetical protein
MRVAEWIVDALAKYGLAERGGFEHAVPQS